MRRHSGPLWPRIPVFISCACVFAITPHGTRIIRNRNPLKALIPEQSCVSASRPFSILTILGAPRLAFETWACAQSPQLPPVPTVQVYSREIVVDLTVTDSKGNPVHGLTRADFTVKEDGHPQAIRSFEEFSPNPSDDFVRPTSPTTPTPTSSRRPHRAPSTSSSSTASTPPRPTPPIPRRSTSPSSFRTASSRGSSNISPPCRPEPGPPSSISPAISIFSKASLPIPISSAPPSTPCDEHRRPRLQRQRVVRPTGHAEPRAPSKPSARSRRTLPDQGPEKPPLVLRRLSHCH